MPKTQSSWLMTTPAFARSSRPHSAPHIEGKGTTVFFALPLAPILSKAPRIENKTAAARQLAEKRLGAEADLLRAASVAENRPTPA